MQVSGAAAGPGQAAAAVPDRRLALYDACTFSPWSMPMARQVVRAAVDAADSGGDPTLKKGMHHLIGEYATSIDPVDYAEAAAEAVGVVPIGGGGRAVIYSLLHHMVSQVIRDTEFMATEVVALILITAGYKGREFRDLFTRILRRIIGEAVPFASPPPAFGDAAVLCAALTVSPMLFLATKYRMPPQVALAVAASPELAGEQHCVWHESGFAAVVTPTVAVLRNWWVTTHRPPLNYRTALWTDQDTALLALAKPAYWGSLTLTPHDLNVMGDAFAACAGLPTEDPAEGTMIRVDYDRFCGERIATIRSILTPMLPKCPVDALTHVSAIVVSFCLHLTAADV